MSAKTKTQAFESLVGLGNDYDQIEKIAIGGMAEVYRARQKTLNRPVAIKRIRPDLQNNESIIERFKREARVSANLLHQNLAHVYNFHEGKKHSYIVMEYIDGHDLAEVIEKSGALPVDVAAIIAIRILRGLAVIHSHGMVHRDIKPDNIRVTSRGNIKIMDFGIAYDPVEENITRPGVLIGSPHYLSPEQVMGKRPNLRSDIFSFGITFYEMLTGKRPFYEFEDEAVFERIAKGKYDSPRSIRPDLPPFFAMIIENCLKSKVNERPGSVVQLANSIYEYVAKNFALSQEARVKQFLIQSGLLNGNPDLIEVNEATDPGIPKNSLARVSSKIKKSPYSKHIALLIKLSIAAGLLFGLYWSGKRLYTSYQNLRAEKKTSMLYQYKNYKS